MFKGAKSDHYLPVSRYVLHHFHFCSSITSSRRRPGSGVPPRLLCLPISREMRGQQASTRTVCLLWELIYRRVMHTTGECITILPVEIHLLYWLCATNHAVRSSLYPMVHNVLTHVQCGVHYDWSISPFFLLPTPFDMFWLAVMFRL